ncbi:MAG: prepilin-type N-terminal cleavage/methylation domain-containing protein [Magnetococcus sp. YQC-5]
MTARRSGIETGQGKSTGFTLIEMVMTLVIISIVGVVGTTSMSNSFNAYLMAQSIEPLANGAHLVLERLRKELRNANTCTGISQPGGTGTLQFTNDQGRVVLVKQGTNPTNSIIMTFNGDGTEWLLAQNVETKSLNFQLSPCTGGLTPGLVSFSFTMATPATDGSILRLPFRTAVYVRSTPS